MSGAGNERWTGTPRPGEAQGEWRPDLAIICGHGSLPLEIAEGAYAAGRRPYMIGIDGEAENSIRAFPGETLGWGQLGALFRLLDQHAIGEVVFAGGIARRPEILKMKLDWGAVKALPTALAFMIGGDNTVLSGAIRLFEKQGVRVVGAHQIAPQLLAPQGRIAGGKPTPKDFQSIERAFAAAQALGSLDIGQAAVAEAGRVVAVEAAEGTDEMLARIARLREIGRMPPKGRNGVLVKTLKPGQDMRADLPAIGPLTVTAVARAGLAGIALEAGRTLILEREQTVRLATGAALYIYGVGAGETGSDG